MRKLVMTPWLAAALLAAHPTAARAADILKEGNADDLSLGSSWVGGTAPTPADVAVWDQTVFSDSTTILGGDLNWLGIRIADPDGLVTVNDSGHVLTLGAAGLDLSVALQDLTLNNAILLGTAQNWNVGTDRTLTVNGVVSGSSMAMLTKSGAGLLLLAGMNTYAGGTTISNGILQLNAAAAAGTGALRLGGGALVYNPAAGLNVANPIEIIAGTTNMLLVTSGAGGNPISSGAWSGSGTVLISNTFSPYTVNASMAAFSGTIVLVTPVGAQFRFNSGGGNPNMGSSDAIFDLGSSAASLRSRNIGTMNLGALLGGPGTSLAGRSSGTGGSTIFSIGARNIDTVFAGTIADGGDSTAITKVGAGKLTLTGANTYTGPTTIASGTLEIGDGGLSGSLGSGPVVNNATLLFNRSDGFDLANAISGAGSLIKQGAGTLTFNGANTSSGTTRINEGTLALGPASTISGPLAVASGGTFDVAASSFVLAQALSGSGHVMGTLTAGANATISPGGNESAATLTFSDGLTLAGGAISRFDLSDDPTGAAKTNDLIEVQGDLTLVGLSSIVVVPLEGSVPPGTYTLIRYSGALNGTLSDLSVSGVNATLMNPPGAIVVVVGTTRPPANLTWAGDNAANSWDENVSANWLNGASPDKFLSFDRVRFDATGSGHPLVNLVGVLLPGSIVVDAATDYTFAGSGRISGSGGLTKTNSGALIMEAAHDYTGSTRIGGGVLAVSHLANGASASGIGAASSDPTNLVFHGTTLRYLGPAASTDRGATLQITGAIIDVATDTTILTASGALVGPGSLTKSGPGTLALVQGSPYSGGTTISNGTLALASQVANNFGGLSALGPTNTSITLKGGTLEMFGYDGANNLNYNTLFNPLVVPAGQVGALRLFQRGPTDNTGLASSLSGDGTLNLVVSYIRGSLDGDWSAFAGRIDVSVKPGVGNAHLRINNTAGYAAASLFLNDGVNMYRNGGANTITDLGELAGSAAAFVGWGTVAQNQAAANPTWRVGAKNTTATFAGTIIDDGSTSIAKVGSGTWILTGINTYSGATTISAGVLALAGDGSIGNSTNIDLAPAAELDVSARADATLTLNMNQTLAGAGTVRGSLVAAAGSTLSPGAAGGTVVGRLAITDALTLQDGALLQMDWSRPFRTNDAIDVAGGVTFGGVLTIRGTLVGGESLKLFNAASYQGAFSAISPDPPGQGLAWDTSQLAVNGTLRVSGSIPVPSIGMIGIAGNLVQITGAGGPPNGAYYVLTSTNVALPAALWASVATNFFGPDGSFAFSHPVDPSTPQQFYLLQNAP